MAAADPAHRAQHSSQTVTDELRHWIVTQTEAGCRPDDIVAAMRASGWDEAVAMEALEQTLRQRLAELDRQRADEPAAAVSAGTRALPDPALGDRSRVTLADGHAVRVLAALRQPPVVVFAELLTDEECQGLMALARPRLTRSQTVDNSTGGNEVNTARTSDGMFFTRGEHPLVATLEQRIAELLHWPLDHGEGLQVLHYGPGAEYRPHYDFFDPQHPGTARILQRGGQRVATLVLYLNTPAGGGATTFPDLGFEVAPQRGHAVFFSYDRPHASTRTLHGGAPVTAGEKWVATKWLREGVFV